ncbi:MULTISPECIES: DUF533 domain-containing protein [Roseobacteraceae]|uniref:DUF533 domain-containing protein n=1 Tax=Roseobacteraceae TaxID=2854170 RepID=UPI00125FED47|nr:MULTISPECIES: DUF533 domain-containing protein [Roseobacteraceae]KAB6714266.1 DUF533 domain-containing protein [Roseobacter sp. TSBP12]|tara:strand:+ start:2280 stop:2990 length:711 start_codon:yes stop_codon:yes gene_type:complete
MSFVRTLTTLAIGFAAAKGVEKVKKMGGMDGVREAMRQSGNPGSVADQMGQMAEKFGFPGGAEAVRGMMGKFGNQAADMSEATEAGLGSLFSAMSGAAASGAASMTDMFASVAQGTPVGAASEENAKLMIRAMIMAAKADGEIDAEERTKILDQLKDASDEEIAFVQAELDAPVDPMALAKDAGTSAAAQVYAAALMAISVDTDAEKTFLMGLAQSLMMDPAKQAEIHQSMGKPVL